MGVSIPEKFKAGIIDKIAEPKIAATCEVAKQDTKRPREVAAQAIQKAPKKSAQKEPVTGTCKITIEINNKIKKLNNAIKM